MGDPIVDKIVQKMYGDDGGAGDDTPDLDARLRGCHEKQQKIYEAWEDEHTRAERLEARVRDLKAENLALKDRIGWMQIAGRRDG